jgi:hypothetical protein
VKTNSCECDGCTSDNPACHQPLYITSYYLNSSVLGLTVTKLAGSGQRLESYVYAGNRKLATAGLAGVAWTHADPMTGSHGLSDASGFYGADAEFNADGIDVGLEAPTSESSYDRESPIPKLGWSPGCSVGNPNCQTCYLDGLQHDCGQVVHLLDIVR